MAGKSINEVISLGVLQRPMLDCDIAGVLRFAVEFAFNRKGFVRSVDEEVVLAEAFNRLARDFLWRGSHRPRRFGG